jgi:hypothetical protein
MHALNSAIIVLQTLARCQSTLRAFADRIKLQSGVRGATHLVNFYELDAFVGVRMEQSVSAELDHGNAIELWLELTGMCSPPALYLEATVSRIDAIGSEVIAEIANSTLTDADECAAALQNALIALCDDSFVAKA